MAYGRWFWGPGTNPAWWTDSDEIETVTWNARANIDYDPMRTAPQFDLGWGRIISFPQAGGLRVRIACELGEQEDVAESMLAPISHMLEGNPVAFTQDTADTWAVPIEAPTRGDLAGTYIGTNVFDLFASITDPVSTNSKLLITSPLPELKREIVAIGGINTGTKAFAIDGNGSHAGVVKTYTVTDDHDYQPWMRPLTFFPFLRLVPGQRKILSCKNGLTWSFAAEFVVDLNMETLYIGGST